MSVDAESLKKQAATFKFTKETATAFHESLFTSHPEIAEHWDAEDIAPEKLCKSQKFMMMGMDEMRQMIGLANNFGTANWKCVLSSLCEYYAETGVPMKEEKIWACLADGVTGAFEKHGGCSAADKASWAALFKQAHADAVAGKYI